MSTPIALDIDGTLTRPDDPDALDHRVFEVLPTWDAPVVFATGMSFPYPTALCDFLGIPRRIVAENGGVIHVDGETVFEGNRERADAVVDEFEARGGSVGWGGGNIENRWRATGVVTDRSADGDLLRKVAAEYGMEVYDTGYAYHVKSPSVEKGRGLKLVADALGIGPAEFIAVGDSVNDASMFEVAGTSYAVANADDTATATADVVTEGSHMDGTMEALRAARNGR